MCTVTDKMEGHRCLAAGLLILVCVVKGAWSAGGGGKAFRLAVSTSDSSTLCAVSEASETTSVSELPLLTAAADLKLPPQVRCAHHCSYHAPCHSFNYRSDNDSCLFYHYPPTVCQPVPSCQYYQVNLYESTFHRGFLVL